MTTWETLSLVLPTPLYIRTYMAVYVCVYVSIRLTCKWMGIGARFPVTTWMDYFQFCQNNSISVDNALSRMPPHQFEGHKRGILLTSWAVLVLGLPISYHVCSFLIVCTHVFCFVRWLPWQSQCHFQATCQWARRRWVNYMHTHMDIHRYIH